jgi:hypothetical protein
VIDSHQGRRAAPQSCFRSGRISTAALNKGPMLHIDIPTLEEFKALGDDVETYSVVDEVARRALSTGARVLGARREELPVPGAADRQLWPGRVVTLANLLGIAEIGANELMLTAQIYDHTARLRAFEIAAEIRRRIDARQPTSLLRSDASIA